MTTATTTSTSFLDGICARLLAAVCLVAAVTLIVHLNRAELFDGQGEQTAMATFPAYTSCRDGEYAKLAGWAKNNPDKWTAEVMIKAKQSANIMCLKKTSAN